LPSWKFTREEHGSHFEWNVIFLESDKKSSLLGPPQAFKYMCSRWILIGWTFPNTTRTKGDQKNLSRGGWGQKRTRAKSRLAQAGTDVERLNPKLGVRTAIVHPLRNKSFSRSSFRVCIFENLLFLDTRFSILDSCVSKLECLDIRDARIEFRGSSQDCQLTFDWYCSHSSYKLTTRHITKFNPQFLGY